MTRKMAALKWSFRAAIPNLCSNCMIQEVPEINDGTVVIDKIVREAGYRTKLTVRSTDPKVDPVELVWGCAAIRVKNVVRELHNEKIDIIPFSQILSSCCKMPYRLSKSAKSTSTKKIRPSPSSSKMMILPLSSAKKG